MTISDYWRIIRSSWRLLLLATVLGGAAAAAVSFPAAPTYQASTSVYFSLPVGTSGSDLSQGSTFTQSQMLSLAELATQPVVLQAVIDELDLDTTERSLARNIEARANSDTVILTIVASATDPGQAADLANTTGRELARVAQELAPETADGSPTLSASIVGEATRPLYPVSPNKRRDLAVGLFAGLLLGAAIAVARVLFDTRVRDDVEASDISRAPVLAKVARQRRLRRSPLLLDADPQSSAAETFRRLRVNLRYLRTAHEVTIVTITSAIAAEGKSTTAVNFAFACAEAGDRVLLVDGDLRRPTIAAVTGLERAVGVTTVLTGQVQLDDAVQRWSGTAAFDVLTAGDLPPNPTELVESGAMTSLLSELRDRYDLVVIDAPPILPVSDAALFAAKTSGAILVSNVRKVRRQELQDAVVSLHQVGATILGLVLNATSPQAQDNYYGARRSGWLEQRRMERRRRTARRRAARRRQT